MNGPGPNQRRIRQAFVANPGARLTTADLIRWCYPRLRGAPKSKHHYCVVRSASFAAERVDRVNPGGYVWELKPFQPLPSDDDRE
jgi:hypothetical protein